MVIHSPATKFTATATTTSVVSPALQQQPSTVASALPSASTTSSDHVPASVLAASAAAASRTVDPLGTASSPHHDFDRWDGDIPPGRRADVSAREEEQAREHVYTETRRSLFTGGRAEGVGDASGVAPPAAGDLPQLNPFTPEWFAQIIGAAATAAATAVASF